MNPPKQLTRALCACLSIAVLVPAGALAHDGRDGDFRSGHHRHHHHFGVLLKGTVSSVDTDNGKLVVKVAKATRGARDLVGDDVTVKVFRAWVADTNNDGKHNMSDFKAGDTVLVKTKRRFIDTTGNTIAAAAVLNKTDSDVSSFRKADDDNRDGRCDHS
jgi:hypothetical protein